MSATENGRLVSPVPMGSTLNKSGLISGANWVASADAAVQEKFLGSLTEGELLALPFLFEFWALDHQMPPEGDWRSWVVIGGRGAGKTRAGAEWVRSMVEGAKPLDAGRARRVALIGETIEQARDVMVFGDSGILACSPPDRRPRWEATKKRLVWDNGAEARVYSAHDPESLRGPQFDAAWCDELGCAAVDKGTNQPNKFLDPKSSESALPVFSDGGRDEAIQRQYYAAVLSYWKSDERNPISDVYGTEMLDLDHAYAWAWDARPYPFFPNNRELWSDAANYEAGHWLNGRTSARSLADTLREICEKSGIENVDVTEVSGVVRGYVSGGSNTGRAMLQSLLIAYGVDAFERDGVLDFSVRNGRPDAVITRDDLTFTPESEGLVEHSRLPFVDDAERVRIGFVEADGNFDAIWEEASLPEETGDNIAVSELPLAMTRSEGRLLAERWLGEARAGKERIQFALPPSQVDISAGNVVRYGEANYRVDRVELSEVQSMEATRVDPEIYLPARMEEDPPAPISFAAPVPVLPVFLDLPIMRGDEVAHVPHIAVTATPWPGNVAVYSASSDVFELSTSVSERATIGVTETPLRSASVGVLDRGEALQVRLSSGNVSDADWVAVLNGVNRVAIGSGSGEDWEVFQFRKAELIAENTYLLSERLRGQFGTDAVMPDVWPEGSLVVLLDQTVGQVPLAPVYRNLALKYRIGPAIRALDDPSYIEETLTFKGVGLRPYRPCHLRLERDQTKDSFTWIRRSRIEGDSWDSLSVPVGEEVESYLVRVVQDGAIKREQITQTPDWQYAVSDRSEDGVIGNYEVSVAQVSATVGPGPFATVLVSA